ncbi:hypothetical protein [Cupriavidus necator]|uniref:hypothetical protein n=1 Tax=Cupriavidus necator TaxID=106590 RepID=UPI0005B3470D|nr:hypothetical protein [Cupriavidus necator]
MSASPDGARLYLNSGNDRILALNLEGQVRLDSGEISGLNPGGGVFGPDGRYYVGLRTRKTIAAFDPDLVGTPVIIVPESVVPFPRGFGFAADGRLFLSSGVGPDGVGQNTVLVFDLPRSQVARQFIADDEVSPLDLAVSPDGNVLISSEFPFGSPNAVTSVREYDGNSGKLVRVFAPPGDVPFQRPRGLRFGPNGELYCTARDTVLTFDYASGQFTGVAVVHPRLNGQAVTLFPRP